MGGRLGLFALCVSVLFSSGCGSSSSSTNTAQLRVFHGAFGVFALNILVNGTTVAGNVNYGAATAYLTVTSGSIHVQAVPVSGGSPILDQTLTIAASAHQTILITGTRSNVHADVLTDGGTTAVSGSGYVRVVNASNTMVASDVYIVNPTTGLTGAMPVTKSPLAFGADTGYQVFPLGGYEVFFTNPGTVIVNLATGPLDLTSSGSLTSTTQTVVAFDAISGGFTYIVFSDQ